MRSRICSPVGLGLSGFFVLASSAEEGSDPAVIEALDIQAHQTETYDCLRRALNGSEVSSLCFSIRARIRLATTASARGDNDFGNHGSRQPWVPLTFIYRNGAQGRRSIASWQTRRRRKTCVRHVQRFVSCLAELIRRVSLGKRPFKIVSMLPII